MTVAVDVRSLTTGSPRRWSGRATSLVCGFGTVLREVALTALAVAGLAAAALTVWAVQHDMAPLVVRSGSMEPTIATGSMIVVERIAAAEIEVADVVAVKRPDGTMVTHRVVSVVQQGEVAMLVLKGDANEDVDPEPVGVVTAQRLVHHVAGVGRAAAWLASAQGGFVVGSLTSAVLLTALRRRTDRRTADAVA